MSTILEVFSALIFYPVLGSIVLLFAKAVGDVAFGKETPGWQTYLWCFATGAVLLNLKYFLSSVPLGDN